MDIVRARFSPVNPCWDTESLLTIQQVAKRLQVSRRTIWRWVATGRFPKPIRFSGVCIRWGAEEVNSFLERLASQRWTLADPA